jgi:cell division protein ZapA
MASRAIELRVGGQNYRVVSSASRGELERFAAVVDEKLAPYVSAGRPLHPNALLLAAISLAHELEAERDRSDRIASRAREVVESIVAQVDDALGVTNATLGVADGGPVSRGGVRLAEELADE